MGGGGYGVSMWGADMGEVVMGHRYGMPIWGELAMGRGYGGRWLWGIDMGGGGYGVSIWGADMGHSYGARIWGEVVMGRR